MSKRALLLCIVLFIAGAVGFYYVETTKIPVPPLNNGAPDKSGLIRLVSPIANQVVQSPLTITGEARGTWYFEASFPVRILDANGKELGIIPAQAQSEWMTENFVPFRAILNFSTPTTETGTLILHKDNPSGLPEHDDELRIPVRFDTSASGKEQSISLYYYNPEKDKDSTGNILCSPKGLVAVSRNIPKSTTPLTDTIKLLLKGELSQSERADGVTTEFPLPGVLLSKAVLNNGVATLTFVDPQNKTSGGACRAGILWYQIEATAKQFSTVQSVKFVPEDIFQP